MPDAGSQHSVWDAARLGMTLRSLRALVIVTASILGVAIPTLGQSREPFLALLNERGLAFGQELDDRDWRALFLSHRPTGFNNESWLAYFSRFMAEVEANFPGRIESRDTWIRDAINSWFEQRCSERDRLAIRERGSEAIEAIRAMLTYEETMMITRSLYKVTEQEAISERLNNAEQSARTHDEKQTLRGLERNDCINGYLLHVRARLLMEPIMHDNARLQASPKIRESLEHLRRIATAMGPK